MSNWSYLVIEASAAGVASYMPTVTVYYYNGNTQFQVNDSHKIQVTFQNNCITAGGFADQFETYDMVQNAPEGAKDKDNWYSYTVTKDPKVNAYTIQKISGYFPNGNYKELWPNYQLTRISDIYITSRQDNPSAIDSNVVDHNTIYAVLEKVTEKTPDIYTETYYSQANQAAAFDVVYMENTFAADGIYTVTDDGGNVLTADGSGNYSIDGAVFSVVPDQSNQKVSVSYTASAVGVRTFSIWEGAAGSGKEHRIKVNTYTIENKVYVLDYGLLVNLTDNDANNTNPLLDSQRESLQLAEVNDAYQKVTLCGVRTAGTEDPFTYSANGTYGVMEAAECGIDSEVIYKPNEFMSGIDRFEYQLCVGRIGVAEENRAPSNSVVMTAGINIMPASVVYYEDNFAAVNTNGDVYDPNPPYDTVSSAMSIFCDDYIDVDWNLYIKNMNNYVDGFTWIGQETGHPRYNGGYYCDYAQNDELYAPNRYYALDLNPGTIGVGELVSGATMYDYAFTKTTNSTKPEDICLVIGGMTTPNGTRLDEQQIVESLIPGQKYVFRCIWDQGTSDMFSIGFGRESDGYAPVYWKSFTAEQYTNQLNQGNFQYVEFTVPTDVDLTGCSLVLYLGKSNDSTDSQSKASNIHLVSPGLRGIYDETREVEGIREQSNSLDMQYGYDPFYQTDGENSFTKQTYTALSSGDKLVFNFQGTGFEILNRTSNGALKVSVYDANVFQVKEYTYNGKKGLSVVAKEGADAVGAIKTLLVDSSYENGTVDQVPLISVDMEAYGDYIVMVQKVGADEVNEDGNITNEICIDGIRIYDPIDPESPELGEVTDAYNKADGTEAVIREVRNMIFGDGYEFNYTNPADPSVTEGTQAVAGLVEMVGESGNQLNIATGSTVIECYTGAMNSGDIANAVSDPASTSSLLGYAVNGPNNELYLTGAQYAFAAVVSGAADDTMLQVGLKAVSDSAAVQYRKADGTWAQIPDAVDPTTGTLTTHLEMYYQIPVGDLWTIGDNKILMIRAAEGTVSLTNLKYDASVTFTKITKALGNDIIKTEDANSSFFNMISKGATANGNVVLTFSLSNHVKDFTLQNKETGEVLFTYGTEAELPEGITVNERKANELKIYVVKMAADAGTYTIYANTGNTHSEADFEI